MNPYCLYWMVFNCDTWHNTNMSHNIFKNIYFVNYVTKLQTL